MFCDCVLCRILFNSLASKHHWTKSHLFSSAIYCSSLLNHIKGHMRGKNGHDQACHSEKITNWFLSRHEINHTSYLYSAGKEGQTHLIWKSVSAWFIIYWESHCSGTGWDCVIQWTQSCQEPALNLIELITTSISHSVTICMPIMATFLQYTDVSVKLELHDLGKI